MNASPVNTARPHPWEMMLHHVKTLRFANDLRQDPHIALVRKLLYLGPMLLLILAVLLPEGMIAALVAEHHAQVFHPGRIAKQRRRLLR